MNQYGVLVMPTPATEVATKEVADRANIGLAAVAIIIARAGRSRRGITGSAKDRRMSAVLLLIAEPAWWLPAAAARQGRSAPTNMLTAISTR
ncbi:MAG: hypothetical protein DYG85_06325 [Chloroflexi bacterium CFX1]|nr:hypothetical protein [Chloroflexi bacterium CFX1]